MAMNDQLVAQKLNITSPQVFSFQILCAADQKFDDFDDAINRYVRSEGPKIEIILKEYIEKAKTSLFFVCDIGGQDDKFIRNHHEHWIACVIVTFNGKSSVFIKDSLESEEYISEKTAFLKFIEQKFVDHSAISFVEHCTREEYTVSGSDISIALNNLKIMIELFKTENKENFEKLFQEAKFCTVHSINVDFDRLIVKVGLKNRFRLKPALQKILSALQRVIDKDNEYKLENTELMKLIDTLGSINFSPRENDEINLKDIVIDLIVILKGRGQNLDEGSQKKIIKYFDDNKDRYIEKVKDFDRTLRQDSRNSQIMGCLGLALKDLLKFFTCIEKLMPDRLTIADLDALFHLLGDTNEQHILEEQRTELENKLSNVTDQNASMDINYELSDVRQKLEYFARKAEVREMADIDDLMIIIGRKSEKHEQVMLARETVDQTLLAGKSTESREVALAVIKILNFIDLSKYNQIEEAIDTVLCNVISQIPLNEGKLILILCQKLPLDKRSSLFRFMYEILIDNDDKELREQAFKILQSCNLHSEDLEHIVSAVQLEEKCMQNNESIIDDLLQRVKVRNKLTLNCFEQLTKYFHNDATNVVINEIVEHGIQQLPKFFVEKCIDYVQLTAASDKDQSSIVSLCNVLLKGQYICLSQIQNIVEKLIDDENSNVAIYDMLSIEVKNEHSIPASIVNKLKLSAQNNEYAANLIKLVEKEHSDIDILKNSRENLTNRKEALKKIMNNSQNCTTVIIKTLESLVKYDVELRTDCFKALVNILPEDYPQQRIKIDLISISECLDYDDDIDLEDISTLVKKNRSVDLSQIVTLIIHRIDIDGEAALNLLSEISHFELQVFDQMQIKLLLTVAFESTDFDFRVKIIDILETIIGKGFSDKTEISKLDDDGNENVYFLTEELNKLHALQNKVINQNNLLSLKKIVEEEGYAITEDYIISLIEALNSNEKQDIHEIICDVLFQIDLRQGFTDAVNSAIFDTIHKNQQLISIDSAVGIIYIGFSQRLEIPEDVVQGLWQQLSKAIEENTLKYNLIYAVRAFVIQRNWIPQLALEQITNSLISSDIDIQFKLLLADILSNVLDKCDDNVQLTPLVTETLRTVVLQSRKKFNDYLLNKIVFRALKASIEENEASHDFLSRYYEIFKRQEISLDKYSTEELKPLDLYMAEKCHALEKFQLMNVINNTFLMQQKIDTSVLSEFHEGEWRKEILCSELLTRIFLEGEIDEGVDEFELQKFRENLESLSSYANEHDSIENILQALLDKQNTHKLSLEIVNDTLIMLQSNIEGVHIVQDEYKNNFYIELRQLWLGERLKYFGIEYSDETLEAFNACLPYRIEIIEEILERVRKDTVIEELIHFFHDLLNCGLTHDSIESFLMNNIPREKSITTWGTILTDRLVGVILVRKFRSYGNYLEYNKLEFSRNTVTHNAYNQANAIYYYSAEDLARISTGWMREFVSNFRIILPLWSQNDRTLSTILTDASNEYKRDRKPTILILNIAGNHWITVVLIHHNQKDIVLYKDSLGEDSYVDEKEEMKQLLTSKIERIDFKHHRSCEQFDDYDSGVFALSNMKIMATLLRDNTEHFIHSFENLKFTSQTQATYNRVHMFPKMYALNLYRSYRRKQIIDYHSVELKFIEDILRKNRLVENELKLSIDLLDEETLLDKDYRYLFKIEASQSKTNIIRTLGITDVYSVKGNILSVFDDKLTAISEKKEKLDLIQSVATLSDSEIDELLSLLGVELTEFNRDILKKYLGVPIKNFLATRSKEIANVEDYESVIHLHKKLNKVVAAGWSMNSIRKLIDFIDTEDVLTYLLHALDPIYEYNLSEYDSNMKGENLFDILRANSSQIWRKEIHELAIFQTFKGSYDKSLEILKTELYQFNRDNQISFLCDEKLITAYVNVQHSYKSKSNLFSDFDTIEHWTSSNIQQWSEKVKSRSNEVSQNEKLAVIKRAVEITSKFPPREIQLLSVLILTNPEENKGRLAQINTGEGKTTIVAMLAAIKALEGHTVDVITSSPELAKPQAKQQQDFFKHFGLTVSHNGKDDGEIKQRYRSDIVYGAAGDFQGDILRDEYSKLGTRSRRKCDIAIVDEVDSMLIDGKNHMVMLSSPMPAMDHLEPLLAAIWIQIEEVAKSIKDIDGKTYFIEQQDMFDENGNIRSDIVENAIAIEGTKENFIKNCTEIHVRRLLRDTENSPKTESDIPVDYPEIKIPKHLRDLVTKTQLTKWIDSAIYAKYRCEFNKHYILKKGKVAPVDASNTGIVQQNMHWSNGLHQFLQIKHGAKITPESLSTNFISNVTYFKRYNKHIYGLTGTLGSISARQLLNNTYSVDCVIIPPFRQKQYRELTPIIVNKEAKHWFDSIVESCINKLENGRGVLVIMKFIKEVDELKNRLIAAGYDESKIKIYKTEDDSMVIGDDLKPGEIIIATNIAGRGTDIKADKIERNGGLHVCVTFLPPNERVEQQNVGRTSRTGNKGTSQFILLEKNEFEFSVLRKIRNINEEDEIMKAESKIKKVMLSDAIFAEFCKLLSEIEDKNDLFIKYKCRAVEERFGIWLKIQEDKISKATSEQQLLEDFEIFRKQILDHRKSNQLIRNPYFHVLIGNQMIDNKKHQEAIIEFSRAIELDEYFQANAYYNRGYARIVAYGGSAKKYKHEIEEAIRDFKEAKKIIEDRLEPMLHVIQKASNSEALSEQVAHKMTLFGIQKNTIEMAIGADVNKEIEAFESQKKQPGINKTDLEKISQQIENLKASKRERETGAISKALDKGNDMEIELLDIKKSLPEDQDINCYLEEIEEYKNNGFIGTFQVKEIKPIDWLSVIGLASLALAQIVGGAALAVFTLGAGSTIGMGLLSEGISDLITAVVDGIINRDFSWASYAIQKAISMTVSLVCAGLGAIKDAAKTAIAGAKHIGSVATKVATETLKKGWVIAAKAIGVELGKGVAKKVVTQLVDYGVNKALMPSIEEEVRKRIESPIQNALLANSTVEKMLRLDGKNRNCYYQNLIKQKAMELLNPQNDPEHVLLTITKGIANGIATCKIQGLSTVLQIAEAVQALDELRQFLPGFIESLNKAIDEISTAESVIGKIEELDKQEQTEVQSQTNYDPQKTTEEIYDHAASTYVPERQDEDINLELNENVEEQVTLEKSTKSPESLRQQLANSVSIKMCSVIQNKLITPVTHAGINFGMKKVTAGLDKSIQDQIGNYQAERRIEFFQDEDKDNRIPDEFKKGGEDEEAVEKADQMIDDLKRGGEAGLPHLGALSDEAGRPIKVLDENGKVIRIIGGDKGGLPIEVEYHKPTEDSPQGHWTLPGNVEPAVNNTGKNNCLFNVIAHQTGKDPNQLRENTATRMENNKENLANQAHDIKRLEQYKSSALTMGGVRLKGNSVYLDDDEIDLIIQTVNSSTYRRMDAPRGLELIDAHDDEGQQVELKRHHMIPEAEIREEFAKLVNKYSNDKNGLKTELNKYINHPNNLIGRQALIRATGLDKVPEIHDNQCGVANSVLAAVSWHTNNIRVGPPGNFRVDDPEAPKSQSKIDYAVADPESKKILDGYARKKGSSNPANILDVQNKLPNNVKHYGWKTTKHPKKSAPRIYEVNKNIKIGTFSKFLKGQTGDRAICNPFREGGQRQFRP
ncbi:unnamed protein product [Rotaria socialis]